MVNILTQRAKPVGDIQRTRGVKVLVFGPAGAGKTTLCATTGTRTLVLSVEGGLLSIRDAEHVDAIEIRSVQEMRDVYAALKGGEHDYEWVCLDSLSEIAELCLKEEKARAGNDIRRAYGELADTMLVLTRAFRDLPLNVLYTCKQELIEAGGVMIRKPSLPGKKLNTDIPYLFDELFWLRRWETEEGETKRALLTVGNEQIPDCKDRSGSLAKWIKPNLAQLCATIHGDD